MPAASAASTRPVPFGTETSTSSMVNVTSSLAMSPSSHSRKRMAVARRDDALERRFAVERAASLLDVRDELVAPVPDVARDRIHREVAERAERLAEDAVADGVQQVDVAELGRARLEALEQLHHPPRP